jgi:hypothetical protein
MKKEKQKRTTTTTIHVKDITRTYTKLRFKLCYKIENLLRADVTQTQKQNENNNKKRKRKTRKTRKTTRTTSSTTTLTEIKILRILCEVIFLPSHKHFTSSMSI